MRSWKLRLALTGAVLIAILAAAAPAMGFEVSIARGGSVALESLGSLTFRGTWTIACPFTFNGSLATGPIPIAAGERIGEITAVRVNNERCAGGTWREILVGPETRAWAIRINSVPAGLPNSITQLEVKILGFKIKLSTFGGFINCLWRGDLPSSLSVSRTRGSEVVFTSGLLSLLANTVALVEGGGCPSTLELDGTFGLSPVQTLTIS